MPRYTQYEHLHFPPEMIARKRLPANPYRKPHTPHPHLTLTWEIADQFKAVTYGFFFHRTYPDNHVTIIPLAKRAAGKNFKSSQGVLNWLTRQAFNCDAFANKALSFIAQQDEQGYIHAWDPIVRNYTRTMRWRTNLLATVEARKIETARKRKATYERNRAKIASLPD